MTKLQILNEVDKIFQLVDKASGFESYIKIQNDLGSLYESIRTSVITDIDSDRTLDALQKDNAKRSLNGSLIGE